MLEAASAYFFSRFTHHVSVKPSTSAVSAQEIQWNPLGIETEVLIKPPPQKATLLLFFQLKSKLAFTGLNAWS